MGNKLKNKRTPARRAATFLAALGVLVMSSGVALMVTATPANAAVKVTFCHSTGSESHPYNELTTSVNAFYVGHVLADHTSDIYPDVTFVKKGQTIHVAAQGDQTILGNHCNEEVTPPGDTEIAVDVEFTDPSCANTNTASFAVTGDDTDVTVQSTAPAAPGATITVTATANKGTVFAGGLPTYSETHSFPVAAVCGTVSTPTTPSVSPPKIKHTKHTKATVTPTVVHAGLAGTTVQDVRGEQGLALMVAGMVMLAGAGGLRLRATGRASRI
ncbi:hypothetical protein ACVW00_003113 [Marmoricola sp. URHA0025 HA25]